MKKIGVLLLFFWGSIYFGFAQTEDMEIKESESTEVKEDVIIEEGAETKEDTEIEESKEIKEYEQTEESLQIKWENNFSAAKELAGKEDKKILIFFTGSDWCSSCKALEEDVINTEKFKNLSKNTILYKADFPRAKDLIPEEQQKENERLKNEYGVYSYPTIVIIDKYGSMFAKKKSYNLIREPMYHFMFLEKYLK